MICSKCKQSFPYNLFATYRNAAGELKRRGICKECRGKYAIDNFEQLKKQRANYNTNNRSLKRVKDANRRKEIKAVIDRLKSEASCADCGLKFPPVAMDFDHKEHKNKSIANMVSGAYKIDLILEEIQLCEIVCACCHRIRTHSRK